MDDSEAIQYALEDVLSGSMIDDQGTRDEDGLIRAMARGELPKKYEHQLNRLEGILERMRYENE